LASSRDTWPFTVGRLIPSSLPISAFDQPRPSASATARSRSVRAASRSLLIAPAVFAVAVELMRLRVDGPSVDAPHASALGFIVLVAGRGLHALLSVLPMVLGAVYARRGGTGGRRYLRRTVAVTVPARTPGIAGERSIAELTRMDAGGHRLGALIRGVDRTAPVLLFVPGAPGGSELGAARRHLAELEKRFVVVTLDRRGGGSSYPALDPTATVTLDSAVADVIAVTEALRRRFHREKIYLLGHSGGSILGVLAVQRRPELYRAYIGPGRLSICPPATRSSTPTSWPGREPRAARGSSAR
jgi:hypothetical protein